MDNKSLIALFGSFFLVVTLSTPASGNGFTPSGSSPIDWPGTGVVSMTDTLNATMFERSVSYQITGGSPEVTVDLADNDEYFYRISANNETNNVDRGSTQGLTLMSPSEQEAYYMDPHYFSYDATTADATVSVYEWKWVTFGCVASGDVVAPPTLTFEDTRPSSQTRTLASYNTFWQSQTPSGNEVLTTGQYIRDVSFDTPNFPSGSSIYFLKYADNVSDNATRALLFSKQSVLATCPQNSSAVKLEIRQGGNPVVSRSLDLNNGLQAYFMGAKIKDDDWDGYSIAVYGGSQLSPIPAVSHFGITTISTSPTSTSNPSPAPYSGPIVTDIGEDNISSPFATSGGQQVRVDGERLSTVSNVFVDGKEGTVVSTADDHFVMIVPEGITEGTYDLVISTSFGNLTYLDGFVFSSTGANNEVANAACEGDEPSYWTQRISDTQAKAYIKCPAVGEKYRILQQTGGSGEYTSIFAKTLTDENDTTQVFNEFGRYIVRTIDLENINRLRITVDDEELWKVRYNR